MSRSPRYSRGRSRSPSPRRSRSPSPGTIPPAISVQDGTDDAKEDLYAQLERLGPSLDPSLKHRIQLPKYETVPIYTLSRETAPRTSRFIFFEGLFPGMTLPSKPYSPLSTLGTQSLLGLRRGFFSSVYYKNGISQSLHYEVDLPDVSKHLSEAADRGLDTAVFEGPGTHIHNKDGNLLYASVDTPHSRRVAELLDLESVARQLLLKDTRLAELGARGNRMINFGFTGSQSGETTGMTYEPQLTAGTEAVGPMFAMMQFLLDDITKTCNFPDAFSDNPYSIRKSQEIHDENRAPYMGVGISRQDFPYSSKCDKLNIHADTETSSRKKDDNILVVNHSFFCLELGCWLDVVVTFSSRKSMDESTTRIDRVKECVDVIWDRRSELPEFQRSITIETFCPSNLPRKTSPIHQNTLVSAAAALNALEANCKIHAKHNNTDFPTRRANDIAYSSFFTNNASRWKLFSDAMLEKYSENGVWPIPETSYYTSCFIKWCVNEFGGLDGNNGLKGHLGALRVQANNTNLVLDEQIGMSIDELDHILARMNVGSPTSAAHKRFSMKMKKNVFGLGDLFVQKMINFQVASFLLLDPNWLLFIVSGSEHQHFKVLSKAPFNLDNKSQVNQVINGISLKKKVPLLYAEENVCHLSKTKLSRKTYFDTLFPGDDIVDVELVNGSIELIRCHYGTSYRSKLVSRRYEATPRAKSTRTDVNKCIVWMSSLKRYANFDTLDAEVLSDDEDVEVDKKQVGKNTTKSPSSLTCFKIDCGPLDVQMLLNKNLFLAVRDIVAFAASTLGVLRDQLTNHLVTRKTTDGGWETIVNEGLTNYLNVTSFQQPSKIDLQKERRRLSHFGLQRRIPDSRNHSWDSEESAFLAAIIHLLFNLRKPLGAHWTVPFLQTKRELLLVSSVDVNNPAKAMVVACFFQVGKKQIFGRMAKPGHGGFAAKFRIC
jgi:hypothetical protein